MNKLNIDSVEFEKSNIILFSKDTNYKNEFMEEIFYKKLSDNKEVFFFDELFDRVEYYPEEPQMGGLVKVRSNLINGLKTYLISIVVGKRRGVTIMVKSSTATLIENECMELLRELVNSDSGCNLIISCDDEAELSGFNFDEKISF